MLLPRADQAVPFQRATFVAPDAGSWNEPPATRSPFGNLARAATTAGGNPGADIEPSDVQAEPSQRTMGALVLCVVPANSSPLGSASNDEIAVTEPYANGPVPSNDHVTPSHCARCGTAALPEAPKRPPATSRPLASTHSASTSPSKPAPSGDQAEPFQLAIRLAVKPPAVVKLPAAASAPFGRTASARTAPSTPVPSGDQTPVAKSNWAMFAAGAPPASW